ncbi:unnamed protein product [Pleuronectes platessa]|uniref:Uncharacterized protein n=1 Tax=Pleuronectes platessa TaxID=8262 RepID=A0A9N7TXZ7_PLEPL|nr:unnamed protein product [Pleuronectes platessa]
MYNVNREAQTESFHSHSKAPGQAPPPLTHTLTHGQRSRDERGEAVNEGRARRHARAPLAEPECTQPHRRESQAECTGSTERATESNARLDVHGASAPRMQGRIPAVREAGYALDASWYLQAVNHSSNRGRRTEDRKKD